MPTIRVPELVIPELPWNVIRRRLLERWDVRQVAHHSVMGQVGSGKSFLARHGILDTCRYDFVLFIDAKGDDSTLEGLGKVVNRYPSRALRAQRRSYHGDKPGVQWYRLVTSHRWEIAKEQVSEALTMVMMEGDCIVVTDELRAITDARVPGLGCRAEWEAIRLRGRSRGIGQVDLTQEPRWVPGSFYTQSSFYWVSRVEDELAQKRIAEIGSSRGLMQHLPTVPKRKWIYTDYLDDERFWAYTQVPARGSH